MRHRTGLTKPPEARRRIDSAWVTVELVPDVITVDLYPVSYPRAPYSKKRIWLDARNLLPLKMIAYDRQERLGSGAAARPF